MNRINKTPGVVYSEKEKLKNNRELISQYDKRIVDMLHKIEFFDATPAQAYKMYMKLQGFLRKKRDLKKLGHIYIPRTETGNYIVDGTVMELEIEDKLQEIYKNLKIEVKFKDFRIYEINVTINNEDINYFDYIYDVTLTLDANISIIRKIIDNKIILPYFRKEE